MKNVGRNLLGNSGWTLRSLLREQKKKCKYHRTRTPWWVASSRLRGENPNEKRNAAGFSVVCGESLKSLLNTSDISQFLTQSLQNEKKHFLKTIFERDFRSWTATDGSGRVCEQTIQFIFHHPWTIEHRSHTQHHAMSQCNDSETKETGKRNKKTSYDLQSCCWSCHFYLVKIVDCDDCLEVSAPVVKCKNFFLMIFLLFPFVRSLVRSHVLWTST